MLGDSSIGESRIRQQDILAFLRTVPLFQDVPVDDINTLARHVKGWEFKAGELILEKGAMEDDLLIVRDGTVSVFIMRENEQIELTQLGQRAYFGEMAIFDEYPRSANVYAVSDVLVFRIRKDNFQTVIRSHPGILFQMAKVFSHRLRRTNSALAQR